MMESERLHPITLVFVLIKTIPGFIRSAAVPLVVALGSGRKSPTTLWIVLGITGALFILNLVGAILRYVSFRFSLNDEEFVIREGVFQKHERHIPLNRIQDVRLQQNVLQRLFQVAEVQLDTGGQGVEATLAVISLRDAESLRTNIFAHEHKAPLGETVLGEGAEEAPLPAPVVEPQETIRELTLAELALAGLTRNWLAPIFPVIFGGMALLRELPEKLLARYTKTALTTTAQAAEGMSAAQLIGGSLSLLLLLIVVGGAASLIRTVILFYGFRLARTGEDLHRTYGLLTRHVIRLPRRRIQVLQIEEEWLRRGLGLATLRADTAGSLIKGGEHAEAGQGSNVLLPILRRDEVDQLLPELLRDSEPTPEHYESVSPLAIRREAMPGTWLCGILTVGGFFLARVLERPLWPALLPLAAIPLFWWASRSGYRQMGYALGEKLFRTRRGILSRSEHIVPLRNIQVVVVRQTPFDRFLKLRSLHVDTAGQAFTGGGPRLSHVPADDALSLARRLAHEAQHRRFEWQK